MIKLCQLFGSDNFFIKTLLVFFNRRLVQNKRTQIKFGLVFDLDITFFYRALLEGSKSRLIVVVVVVDPNVVVKHKRS